MVGATSAHRYRALVVEDEVELCRGIIRALSKEGFECTGAANGSEALAFLRQNRCDAIVTDLAMPVVNGHTLAVEVLNKPTRPVFVVLTGINEPRIAKDLIKRGVDDIIFKPVEFAVLSAKVLALVEKAHARAANLKSARDAQSDNACRLPDDYQQRIDAITAMPPFSPAVFDIFRMAQSDQGDAEQLAANLARDASLAVEVLRLANSAFYNPCGESITELCIAVARIGRRRICALALSRHLITTTQHRHQELTNSQLAWRQSVGAGVAIELLIDAGGYRCVCDEIFLCALMHSLGRLVQVSMFPDIYQDLLTRCLQSRTALIDEENRVFPQSHSGMLARLLKQWGIAPTVHEPLNNVEDSYEQIANMTDPLRTQVELLKIAAFIGRIAGGGWENWDCLELPPPETLQRLGLGAKVLDQIVKKTIVDTERICSFRTENDSDQQQLSKGGATDSQQKMIEYFVPENMYFDWLRNLLPAMAIKADAPEGCATNNDACIAFNLTGTTDRDIANLQAVARPKDLILVPQSKAHLVTCAGKILKLPCSFLALKEALSEISWSGEASAESPAAAAEALDASS